jgi:DAK2 domain fusion protein YloV
VDEVNALNVYPVPDGDTGTNMLHTMRAALEHARRAEQQPAVMLAAAAHGALMGARGNSGVILSQVLRGLKESYGPEGIDLRQALSLARTCAYAAVDKPAPGTMLTMLADVDSRLGAGERGAREVLHEIVKLGGEAVRRTQGENPVNKAAGVVDAGARGLWLLIDGALASVEGRAPSTTIAPHVTPIVVGASSGEAPSWEGAYDVQFLVTEPSRPIDELRAAMLEFGADCVLVVGDETVAKIHVHTLEPDQIIRIGLTAGRISDVVVEDLDAMSAQHAETTGIVVPSAHRDPTAVGVVTVVPGDGFARIASSLGAHVVRGGASMNPSTEELLAAIRQANAAEVIVLPNDKNVILAAEQAAKLAGSPVTVLPTRNVAQGMAALASWDQGEAAADAIAAMRTAVSGSHAIEITTAIRDADVDGQRVGRGEHLALLDGKLVAHSDTELSALAGGAKSLTEASLFTLYVGAGVDDARRAAAAERLRAMFPGAEVEVVDGGQPHYPFIVAAE